MTIVPKKIILCLSSIFLLLLVVLSTPVSAVEMRSKEAIQREIDDYVRKMMKDNHIQGAALAITSREEGFYTQGYGASSDGRGITGKTLFPIASLSKSFTALAVLQLVERGRIDLDTAYISYFPDLAPDDKRVRDVTIRQMLNQTSGLNDKVNPDMTQSPQYKSLQEINLSLNNVKLASDPGTDYRYHNPNYQFLARLVEQVSGQPFSKYLKHNVLDRLGMSQSFNVSTTQQINENSAIPRGHYLFMGNPVRQAEPNWFVDGPAGVISTAEDMANWMLAQYHGHLLAPELMEQYHAAGEQGPYGMGWLAGEEEQAGRTISHSGIFWTYKAEEKIYLDQQLGIVMMFDTGLNAFVNYSAFIDGIARIMKGEPADISIFNHRNMEIVMLVFIIATILWGAYLHVRIKGRKKRITIGKLIGSSLWRLFPPLFLLCLSPLMTFVGGGRVLPWIGLWYTMSSVILWLIVLSLVNIVNGVYLFRTYYRTSVNETKRENYL